MSNSIDQYFNLKDENALLSEENKQLRAQLYNSISTSDSTYIDTTYSNGNYRVVTADVYKNSYSLTNNYRVFNMEW